VPQGARRLPGALGLFGCSMPSPSADKLAVLIDADNAQASIASELLAEISSYGTATVGRAYGDWTTPNLSGWKEALHNLAIQPIQQFRFTVGSLLVKASPSFDPRNYGFQKLGELVRRQPFLEVKSVPAGDGSPNMHLYVRLKEP